MLADLVLCSNVWTASSSWYELSNFGELLQLALPVRAVILWFETGAATKQEKVGNKIRMCHLGKEQEIAQVVFKKSSNFVWFEQR